jgi:hypothetical protein
MLACGKGAFMKFRPGSVKQPELTDREKAALQAIASGAIVEPLLCQRLKALGLAEQSRAGWALTHQGQICLIFKNAR